MNSWREWNLEDGKKSKIYYIIFIILLIACSALFVGCAKPVIEDKVMKVCEDGYEYNVIKGSYKKIVVENGAFRRCESGVIVYKEIK